MPTECSRGQDCPSAPRCSLRPPETIHYSLDEALTLLAALEDARTLVESGHLTVVVNVEAEIRLLEPVSWLSRSEGDGDAQ